MKPQKITVHQQLQQLKYSKVLSWGLGFSGWSLRLSKISRAWQLLFQWANLVAVAVAGRTLVLPKRRWRIKTSGSGLKHERQRRKFLVFKNPVSMMRKKQQKTKSSELCKFFIRVNQTSWSLQVRSYVQYYAARVWKHSEVQDLIQHCTEDFCYFKRIQSSNHPSIVNELFHIRHQMRLRFRTPREKASKAWPEARHLKQEIRACHRLRTWFCWLIL